MKKIVLLPLVLALIALSSKATIHLVQVTNNQFNPANITDVFVGDVVRFQFVQGFHNAISTGVTNAIPAGANPINSGAPSGTNPRTYDYPVIQAGTYKYVCQVHADAATYTGMIGQFIVSVVTPVKLSFFNVSNADQNASISWKTQNEQNVDHFSVRRSLNGLNFTEVARIPAAGNSVSEKSYSFTDSKISSEKFYYYSLAIVDKDGRQTFSETKLFKNLRSIPKLILSLSPNPMSGAGHLMMIFNAAKEGKMQVRLIDPQGKAIASSVMQAYEGVNNGHFHLGKLPAGTYTLICILDGLKESHTIIFR